MQFGWEVMGAARARGGPAVERREKKVQARRDSHLLSAVPSSVQQW